VSDLVKESSFNDGEVIRGMVLQGERHTYRDPSFPEENKCLFTIPIRRRIVGKAVAILTDLDVLSGDGHSINVMQFNKDCLDSLDSDTLVANAVNSGIDPDAVKELAAAIEMAANGNWIKDGDYFAFYWCDGWAVVTEHANESEESQPRWDKTHHDYMMGDYNRDDEEEEEAEDQELVEE